MRSSIVTKCWFSGFIFIAMLFGNIASIQLYQLTHLKAVYFVDIGMRIILIISALNWLYYNVRKVIIDIKHFIEFYKGRILKKILYIMIGNVLLSIVLTVGYSLVVKHIMIVVFFVSLLITLFMSILRINDYIENDLKIVKE